MRLSLALATWPKYMPNGNIHIGKHQMVRKVRDKHLREMWRDVEREKTNAFICINPAVTKEQEAEMFERSDRHLRSDQLWFKMRKAFVEGTKQNGPVPLSQHYLSLRKGESWEY